MADTSTMEWTDATWNIITGCTLVDEGCRHCYAARMAATWPAIANHPSRKGLARVNAAGEAKFTGEVRFNEQWLDQPLRWKKPRRIFVCAHGDLFHENVPDEWIDSVFAVMALAPQHTFQVLTKRPDRMQAYLTAAPARAWDACLDLCEKWEDGGLKVKLLTLSGDPFLFALGAAGARWGDERPWPLPNVWLGTSISDQASADARIPDLLATPAAVRFLSAEPLLGPVDLMPYLFIFTAMDEHFLDAHPDEPLPFNDPATTDPAMIVTPRLDWVIAGGESGPKARPMHPDWARALRDQCKASGVAFFFKQWGEWGAGSVNMSTGAAVFRAFPNFLTWVNKGSTWVNGGTCLDAKGRFCATGADMMRARDDGSFPVTVMHRIGKARAGRLLDGVEWSQMPGKG